MEHVPRGAGHALAPAAAILLGREPGADDPEADEAAETVSDLATAFGRDLAASRARVRIADVSAAAVQTSQASNDLLNASGELAQQAEALTLEMDKLAEA